MSASGRTMALENHLPIECPRMHARASPRQLYAYSDRVDDALREAKLPSPCARMRPLFSTTPPARSVS